MLQYATQNIIHRTSLKIWRSLWNSGFYVPE